MDLFCNINTSQPSFIISHHHSVMNDDNIDYLTNNVTKNDVSQTLSFMNNFKSLVQCILFKQYLHIISDCVFKLVKTNFSTRYFFIKTSMKLSYPSFPKLTFQ